MKNREPAGESDLSFTITNTAPCGQYTPTCRPKSTTVRAASGQNRYWTTTLGIVSTLKGEGWNAYMRYNKIDPMKSTAMSPKINPPARVGLVSQPQKLKIALTLSGVVA